MVPLVENNYNLAELGPRGTGKSHIYKEISPNSILVSGGQTTVANLFYNMARRQVGLVGLWDVVAFDEVAGISFKDKDGVQIMKDYMASGSFARGRDSINAYASMVFVGNINQPVDTLVKTSHLFAPFPETMIDSAFFDRFHAYVPGWEIPKMRPEFFTNQYGLIVDYLAEWLREMRKRNFGDAINKYFKLGRDLNQRDTIAVKHTVSGLLKLLYPHEEYDKEAVRRCLEYALEARRRVKEQLKKIGGMEFFDVHFSYIDQESLEEKFISVPEQGGGTLIPDGPLSPGVMHTVATGSGGHLGLYRLEIVAALVNAVLLFAVAGYVAYEAINRFTNARNVASTPVLIVGVIGLVVNGVAFVLLRAGSKESLNLQGAYLEVLSDTLGSIAVIVAAIIWGITGWDWVDPLIGVGIGLFILPRAWRLGHEALRVLIQAAPARLDLPALQSDIAAIDGVVDVHDFHVWTLTSEMDVVTAHLVVTAGTDTHGVLDRARALLADSYGITHATFQVEPDDHRGCDELTW
jgi:cation diffusion facilitator family transporter